MRISSYRNIHLPKADSSGNASGETPSISEVRRSQLNAFDLPDRGTPGTTALYKFVDGETLSQADSRKLSGWLREAGLQDVERCFAMQQGSSFIPTLSLTSGSSEEVIGMLKQFHDSGMKFGVSVSDCIPDDIAQALYEVMASPQSRVTSFDYHQPNYVFATDAVLATRDLLSRCIKHCDTLECVSGSPQVLSLLEHGLPEIGLDFLGADCDAEDQFRELLRVLSEGGVERLEVTSMEAHELRSVVRAVVEANLRLSPERSVQQIELHAPDTIDPGDGKRIVAQAFSARHLTRMTLPSPDWVPELSEMRDRHTAGCWLQSLQLLVFNARDGLDDDDGNDIDNTMHWLDPTLRRNEQMRRFATEGATELFTKAMSLHLFQGGENQTRKDHTNVPIQPLVEHFGKFFNTRDSQSLTVVNRATAAGAQEGRRKAEEHYQNNLTVQSMSQAATQPLDSDANSDSSEV
ncbi:hypothetical protein H6CHR_05439 [Variovorax sp. PBL-H6]|uniref:hypothetical protein n=1 Tax=Variovorax sp. PBL-H6 TaxID=434009 RepID=UPI001318EB90|nr:hypothetical protein [Variovorax sp. PBL-H6]VTU39293.1 hypothetical protein H6CHR_05439 [Variovorax sp. PBL-H6]